MIFFPVFTIVIRHHCPHFAAIVQKSRTILAPEIYQTQNSRRITFRRKKKDHDERDPHKSTGFEMLDVLKTRQEVLLAPEKTAHNNNNKKSVAYTCGQHIRRARKSGHNRWRTYVDATVSSLQRVRPFPFVCRELATGHVFLICFSRSTMTKRTKREKKKERRSREEKADEQNKHSFLNRQADPPWLYAVNAVRGSCTVSDSSKKSLQRRPFRRDDSSLARSLLQSESDGRPVAMSLPK